MNVSNQKAQKLEKHVMVAREVSSDNLDNAIPISLITLGQPVTYICNKNRQGPERVQRADIYLTQS